MQFPPNNSVSTPVGLDAIHPLSRGVRRRASELIQDKKALALFHEPLIGHMTKPQGVPDELWDTMTDEHKELVTYKVVSEALQEGLRRSEGL